MPDHWVASCAETDCTALQLSVCVLQCDKDLAGMLCGRLCLLHVSIELSVSVPSKGCQYLHMQSGMHCAALLHKGLAICWMTCTDFPLSLHTSSVSNQHYWVSLLTFLACRTGGRKSLGFSFIIWVRSSSGTPQRSTL